jgi:hypothetical protein
MNLGRADLLVSLAAQQRRPAGFMAPRRDSEIVEAFHEPFLGAPASRRRDASAPGFMVPIHAIKRKEATH